MAAPTFVYDGDCSFCTACAEFIGRRIPTSARLVPWQFADLDALGLTVEQCDKAVQWVGENTAAGPDAIALLLRDAGRMWRLAGTALQWRPVRLAAWPVYHWVAEHRHLLPGGTAACSLPQAQRELPGRTR
ncbi:DCC1-like thiol-disulfide oxidoreductase family protein [Actinoplanes sp. NEAU-A12]|uniref:DCC1-like thiol-disulfide oxidoreductase family protein n=1 Tax=Actinoplanes sandaracinus TaxID=3045177 RepID=A0ABT6WBD6_9ACTN|nr:DCC1-like thiol-disulfide oxidoreductase family protein [Actinoplanes sandaracinus]MDI6097020.1 DCC1-like thiol-disulfide oxidoreductase family protein [Actinoplanes sandaracinus]